MRQRASIRDVFARALLPPLKLWKGFGRNISDRVERSDRTWIDYFGEATTALRS